MIEMNWKDCVACSSILWRLGFTSTIVEPTSIRHWVNGWAESPMSMDRGIDLHVQYKPTFLDFTSFGGQGAQEGLLPWYSRSFTLVFRNTTRDMHMAHCTHCFLI